MIVYHSQDIVFPQGGPRAMLCLLEKNDEHVTSRHPYIACTLAYMCGSCVHTCRILYRIASKTFFRSSLIICSTHIPPIGIRQFSHFPLENEQKYSASVCNEEQRKGKLLHHTRLCSSPETPKQHLIYKEHTVLCEQGGPVYWNTPSKLICPLLVALVGGLATK